MKILLLFGVLLLSLLVTAIAPPQKVLRVKAVLPDGASFSAFVYEDGTFGGQAMYKDLNGNPLQASIWDIAYSVEEQYVAVLVGVTAEDAMLAEFQLIEGVSTQTAFWLDGEKQFMVEMHLFTE